MDILIVEDDDVSRELLREALQVAGYNVDIAADGCDALDLLSRTDYQMVISDWEMPKMSGLDLCREIRARSLEHYVYIILLTARQSQEDVVAGLSAGADDFVSKPFDPGELHLRIRAGERILALETREVAIFAMAKLAESRDTDTGEHLERIRAYCRMIGKHLLEQGHFPEELNEQFVRTLYLTSPLHDIGKVGIPDSVLLKPARLDDDEFAIMKTHASIGARTLDAAVHQYPNVAYLRMARDIALTHHERYDGKGYPNGLAGEEIPLCGRIVAVADVYDALTSRRVYKPAFAHTIARNMIENDLGTHFDPVVGDAFLAIEAAVSDVQNECGENGPMTRQVPAQSC